VKHESSDLFPLVVGHHLLPSALKICSHMNYVYVALALIIVQVIVHIGDNLPIFHMDK
jgi:hypothetical protein